MHRLLTSLILLTASFGFAAPGKVSISAISEKQLLIDNINAPRNSQSLQLSSPTIDKYYTFGAGIVKDEVDLSNRTITQQNGVVVPLSRFETGLRRSVNFQAEIQIADWLFSARHSQDIDPTTYAAKAYGLQIQKGFYSRATSLSFDFNRSALSQPQSVFVDPETLKTKPQATEFSKDQIRVQLEQIWTENLKSSFDIADIQNPQIRPHNYALGNKNAYALDSRHTFRLDFGLARENENEKLKTDQGYFRSEWTEAQWTYEYFLDSFFGTSVSFLHESEQDPRRGYTRELGTDAVGIFVQHQIKKININLRAVAAVNSDRQNSSYLEGGFSWEI